MDNILNKIREWLRRFGTACGRFMEGRNGLDALNRALFWGYIILSFLRAIFTGGRGLAAGVYSLFINAMVLLLLFRFFSRDLNRRQAENRKWLDFAARTRERWNQAEVSRYWRRTREFVTGQAVRLWKSKRAVRARKSVSEQVSRTREYLFRVRDREHKYFTCEHCGAVCRVPRGKGKIVITCPRCGSSIEGKS